MSEEVTEVRIRPLSFLLPVVSVPKSELCDFRVTKELLQDDCGSRQMKARSLYF